MSSYLSSAEVAGDFGLRPCRTICVVFCFLRTSSLFVYTHFYLDFSLNHDFAFRKNSIICKQPPRISA